MRSIKANYIYNLLYILTGILFPLFTFSYSLRTIGAEGIGIVQFYESIINYIVLFTSLGIPMYATREISKCKNDVKKTCKTSVEIITLYLMLTAVGYLIVFLLILFVGQITAHYVVFLILSSVIMSEAIGTSWFFTAMEDFKFIAIRSITIRTFLLILLFAFVNSYDDFILYVVIHVASVVLVHIANFVRLHKYIKRPISLHIDKQVFRHLKPSLKLFALNCIVSIYINIDSVMLGFMTNEATVGFYTIAIKLTRTCICIVTALGTTILPKLIGYLRDEQMQQFKDLCNKAVNFTLLLALPITMGLITLSEPIIEAFCGDGYESSITPMIVLAPITLFVSLSSLFGNQFLYAQGKENLIIIASIVGTLINVSLNYLLIPLYSSVGAAIATSCGEGAVAITLIIIGRKYYPFKLWNWQRVKYIGATFLMTGAIIAMQFLKLSTWPNLIVSGCVAAIVYGVILYFQKDYFVVSTLNKYINKYQEYIQSKKG